MREVVVRCERHPDRDGIEVRIVLDSQEARVVDLCDQCLKPVRELLQLGRPVADPTIPGVPASGPKYDRTLSSRIRNVPPTTR